MSRSRPTAACAYYQYKYYWMYHWRYGEYKHRWRYGTGTPSDHDDAAALDNKEENNDEDGGTIDIASSLFCTAAEQDALLYDCRMLAATIEELALSLFERIDTPVGGNLVGDSQEAAQAKWQWWGRFDRFLQLYCNNNKTFALWAWRLLSFLWSNISDGREHIETYNRYLWTPSTIYLTRKNVSQIIRVACAANLQNTLSASLWLLGLLKSNRQSYSSRHLVSWFQSLHLFEEHWNIQCKIVILVKLFLTC